MNYSILITASHIKSHPSIDFIRYTIESLEHLSMKPSTQIILAHDYSPEPKYAIYLENLSLYTADKPYIKIVVRETHGHLTGNIRHALQYITSPYVLILQHDLPFTRPLVIGNVVNDMMLNSELKHIRFNKRANQRAGWDTLNGLFGKQIISTNYSYTRTPAWSDQNHLVHTDYYREIVLKECKDGTFMESQLHGRSLNELTHQKYGTYIFGGLDEPAFIRHLNGRIATVIS